MTDNKNQVKTREEIISEAKSKYGDCIHEIGVGTIRAIFRTPTPSEIRKIRRAVWKTVENVDPNATEEEQSDILEDLEDAFNEQITRTCIVHPDLTNDEVSAAIPPGFYSTVGDTIQRVGGYLPSEVMKL